MRQQSSAPAPSPTRELRGLALYRAQAPTSLAGRHHTAASGITAHRVRTEQFLKRGNDGNPAWMQLHSTCQLGGKYEEEET
jgi:hypothetical protein